MSIVTGNTYPVRQHLKAMGARAVKDATGRFIGWDVPEEHVETARRLVASVERAPQHTPRPHPTTVDRTPAPVTVVKVPVPLATVTEARTLLAGAAALLAAVEGSAPLDLGLQAAAWLRAYRAAYPAPATVRPLEDAAQVVAEVPPAARVVQAAPVQARQEPARTPPAPAPTPAPAPAAKAVPGPAQAATGAAPLSGALAWATGK